MKHTNRPTSQPEAAAFADLQPTSSRESQAAAIVRPVSELLTSGMVSSVAVRTYMAGLEKVMADVETGPDFADLASDYETARVALEEARRDAGTAKVLTAAAAVLLEQQGRDHLTGAIVFRAAVLCGALRQSATPSSIGYKVDKHGYRLEISAGEVNVSARFRGSVAIPLDTIEAVGTRPWRSTRILQLATRKGLYEFALGDRADEAARAVASAAGLPYVPGAAVTA